MRIDKLSDNLYTPPYLVADIVNFYGGRIDLDPAADPQKHIPALNHYTFEDDGLSKQWNGKIFCNPPYSKNNGTSIQDWVHKGYSSVDEDPSKKTELLMLLPVNLDTRWGQMILKRVNYRLSKVLFFSGRIKFLKADYALSDSTGLFASMLVYDGLRRTKFKFYFSHMGVIF